MELVGRQWEMARADRFLDDVADGPAALVLEGDPGIGKTTVWRAAADAARSRSYRVLTCRASESERALSFLGLGDLLERMPDKLLEALPEPQREALRSALLRSAGAGSPDRVSVARGALGVLRLSATEAPTVVAIDDAQWLDAPSADACRFVVHRLAEERIGFLVSVRDGATSPLELEQAFPGGELVRLRLEALELDELEEVVGLHLPVSFTQPTWQALYRISGGNPFFALQLAEALERRGPQPLGEGLPIPKTLAEAMRERLAGLSAVARSTLLPVAALAQPTLSLLWEAATERDGVEEAVRAGVLQVDGERVRFTHPLLGSFVYGDASDAERRDVHGLLAPLVTDREEQALHLARGTVEPDEAVAATLEATAEQAAKRGHPEIAAELAERAVRLTAAEHVDDRARRVRETARALFAVGDGPRARELLEELVAQLPASRGARTGAEPPRLRSQRHLPLDSAVRRCSRPDRRGSPAALADPLLPLLEGGDAGPLGRGSAARPRSRRAGRAFGEPCSARREPRPAGLERARASTAGDDRARGGARAIARRAAAVGSEPELRPRACSSSPSDRIDEARRQFEEEYERAVAVGDWWRSSPPRAGSRRSSSGPGTGRRHAPTRGERGRSAGRT